MTCRLLDRFPAELAQLQQDVADSAVLVIDGRHGRRSCRRASRARCRSAIERRLLAGLHRLDQLLEPLDRRLLPSDALRVLMARR
jgi:hypothetical protein